jgi:hypothetical protein
MNTDALARQYETLTPWERVPLLLAASARGDQVEVNRLARSAPRQGFWIADFLGLVDGLDDLAKQHLLRQLDLAVCYTQMTTLLESERMSSGRRARREEKRIWQVLRMVSHRFLAQADGWKQLCAELHIDSEVLLQDLPGYETVQRMQAQVRLIAFTAEEARAYLRQILKRRQATEEKPSIAEQEARVHDAAAVARSMRAFLEARLGASW